VEIGDVGQQPQRRPGQVEQHRAAEAKMRRAGFQKKSVSCSEIWRSLSTTP
jgi:hypothetical protein